MIKEKPKYFKVEEIIAYFEGKFGEVLSTSPTKQSSYNCIYRYFFLKFAKYESAAAALCKEKKLFL